jgi:hypothetical protein
VVGERVWTRPLTLNRDRSGEIGLKVKSKKWIVRGYLAEDETATNIYYEVEAETEREAEQLGEQRARADFPYDLIAGAGFVAEPYSEARAWGKV